MLPYFLGCPSWSEAAWRGSLYPADMPAAASLATYCQVFNAVEGNTTFYARPAPATPVALGRADAGALSFLRQATARYQSQP